ncbi:MAG: hypothetical protein KF774_08010 [Planctomyces sp.]|nr:hypothetical protein [Planctomyces sp.]
MLLINLCTALACASSSAGEHSSATTTYGDQNQAWTFVASLYVENTTPPPGVYSPVTGEQRRSMTAGVPTYDPGTMQYKHVHVKTWTGLTAGRKYRVDIEEWNPNANNGAGGWEWRQTEFWTQPN